MRYPLYQINAFSDQPFGGNPACVVPLAAWLPDEVMLGIAQQNAVAETAFFILETTSVALRWFTPDIEIDLCGHGTLATAHCLLAHQKFTQQPIHFTTKSGSLYVSYHNGLVEDEEISKQMERSFIKSGIKVMTNAEVTQVDTSGKGVKATIKTKNGDEVLSADIVLSAVGIKTNIENIGLEDLGIATDKDKIIVNDFYQTNLPGYYAIGDVTSGQALAHVASAEGILCVEKIAGQQVEPIDYNNVPGCTYCFPEIASVGYTEAQAIENGYEIKVGKFPFTASGKAQAGGHTDGFIKVIFDAKYGEWLGCHMIGAGVTDMIAEAVVGRKLETTGCEILKAIHPHPTMSEAVMEAVAAAYDEVIHI